MRHACLLAALGALVIVLVPQAAARQQRPARESTADRAQLRVLLDQIVDNRDETWRWQRLMGRPRSPYGASAERTRSVPYRKWVLRLWARRAVVVRKQAHDPPRKRDWLCIHRYEGSWTDPNAPYYGGLQMDLEFQQTYGPELLRKKGTADNWTPLEQIWVAVRAYRSGRGFYPWPNTARYCGLI